MLSRPTACLRPILVLIQPLHGRLCPLKILAFARNLLLLLLPLQRIIWWRHVRMVTRVPETAPENPPELGEIQLHRHVDPILGADVVGAGPLALILLGHVEDRGRHDASSPFTTLPFRKLELDCLARRNHPAYNVKRRRFPSPPWRR